MRPARRSIKLEPPRSVREDLNCEPPRSVRSPTVTPKFWTRRRWGTPSTLGTVTSSVHRDSRGAPYDARRTGRAEPCSAVARPRRRGRAVLAAAALGVAVPSARDSPTGGPTCRQRPRRGNRRRRDAPPAIRCSARCCCSSSVPDADAPANARDLAIDLATTTLPWALLPNDAHPITVGRFGTDGNSFATGSSDGTVKVLAGGQDAGHDREQGRRHRLAGDRTEAAARCW